MALELQFLGTGNAPQVPVYNCHCKACQRARHEPRFKRGPCSVVLLIDDQQWLIDGGCTDLCERFPAPSLKGILQTHYHADHAQGLLHLRWGAKLSIPVWGPNDPQGFADLYKHPGILDFSQPWAEFESRRIGGATVTAVPLNHSKLCLGYVIEHDGVCVAYLMDTVGLPQRTHDWLTTKQLNYCIVDCSEPPAEQTPRNHNDVNSALAMCDGLSIQHLIFTHIGHELDEWLMAHAAQLPSHVDIAFDGMHLQLSVD